MTFVIKYQKQYFMFSQSLYRKELYEGMRKGYLYSRRDREDISVNRIRTAMIVLKWHMQSAYVIFSDIAALFGYYDRKLNADGGYEGRWNNTKY